jgi:hypothetical protein
VSNLTLSIDAAVLRRARVRAVTEGVSVNALVRRFVEEYADGNVARAQALDKLEELADRAAASSGAAGRVWTRDDLHER